jgi:hypothetical protein
VGARLLVVMTVVLAVAGPAPVVAQPPASRPRPGLEQLSRVIEERLQLDATQAARLREVSARYAARRAALAADEREARRTLRDELARGDAADQPRVADALATVLDVRRRRLALVTDEQRDLSAFLTPVQRARFLALQERALRAAQGARMRRGDDAPWRGRRRPPDRPPSD